MVLHLHLEVSTLPYQVIDTCSYSQQFMDQFFFTPLMKEVKGKKLQKNCSNRLIFTTTATLAALYSSLWHPAEGFSPDFIQYNHFKCKFQTEGC